MCVWGRKCDTLSLDLNPERVHLFIYSFIHFFFLWGGGGGAGECESRYVIAIQNIAVQVAVKSHIVSNPT